MRWTKTWTAFSMSNGIVYFQTGVIWEGIKELARRYRKNTVLLAEADQSARQDYLYTVVNMMREKGMTANLIQKEFFGGYFDVHMAEGKTYNAYFTPFYAEVFADTVSELEGLKKGKLKEIVKVEPAYGT